MNPTRGSIPWRLACAAVATLLIAACGGGGGSGAKVAGPSVTLALDGVAMTESDLVVVHGAAASPAGVDAVDVEGVGAQTADDFASFAAIVPLAAGSNGLDLAARDRAGRTRTQRNALAVERVSTILASAQGVAFNPKDGRYLVTDFVRTALFALDPVTGERTLIAGDSRGTGSSMTHADFIAIDAVKQRAFVSGLNPSNIYVVDLATGDRTSFVRKTVFDSGVGFDAPRGRVLYTDESFASVIRAFDLTARTDKIVSDGDDGQSPPMQSPRFPVHDPTRDRIFVVDFDSSSVLAVDPVSGKRKVISDLGDPALGPTTSAPGPLALDAKDDLLLLFETEHGDLLAIDPDSGVRSQLVPGDPALGPVPAFATGLAFDEALGQAVATTSDGTLIRFDPVARRRTEFGNPRLGDGPTILNGNELAFDARRSRLVVLDLPNRSLFAVGLKNGARSLLLDESDSVSSAPFDVSVDPSRDRYLIADALRGLLAFDPVRGGVTVLSNDTHGSGPSIGFDPTCLAADGAGGAFLFDGTALRLLRVDLASGDRTAVAELGDGKGPELIALADLVIDPDRNRLLALDFARRGLIAIDLATGARTGFADDVNPNTPDVPKGRLAIDPGRGVLFATDPGSQPARVIAVDLATGARSVISSGSVGIGTNLFDVRSIAGDPARGRLLAFDKLLLAFAQIEMDGGDRVIVSR